MRREGDAVDRRKHTADVNARAAVAKACGEEDFGRRAASSVTEICPFSENTLSGREDTS